MAPRSTPRRARHGQRPVPVSLRAVDGVALAGLHWPARPRTLGCVVAHGFTGSSRNRDVMRISRALADRGMGVLAVDFRGHGQSGGASTAGAAEIHDVAAAERWLRAVGYARVALLGWSMGGTAVLRHAGLGGAADAVVSVSAPGTWTERETRSMQVVHWIFEHRTGRAGARVLRRTRIAPDAWANLPEPPAEVIGAIAPRPLLIVHGELDQYFPLHHAEALAAAAPGADLWVEPGMGHAELATSAELLARVADWVRAALEPGTPGAVGAAVWDDGARD